jgi:hypothetical protein
LYLRIKGPQAELGEKFAFSSRSLGTRKKAFGLPEPKLKGYLVAAGFSLRLGTARRAPTIKLLA